MKPTIKSIAEYAGVSRGVVDRVLHGRPNVNPAKRQRVEEALKKLNYSPDPAARALALKNKKMKIGVIFPHWSGYFASEVARGLEVATKELHDYGMDILVRSCETDLPDEYVESIDALLAEGAAGLAICAKDAPPIQRKVREIARHNFPVVTFNSDLTDSGRLCFVGENVVQSGRTAGEIMSRLLPKRGEVLVVCGNREFSGHGGRVEGFIERYRELGRAEDAETVLETHNDYDLTYQKVGKHLKTRPDTAGIYMANDGLAGCVEAIKAAGKSGAIRVVCHDLSDVTIRLLKEGMVDFAIEQNIFRQGYLPAKILNDYLLAGKKPERDIEYNKIQVACAENIY